MSKKKTKIFVIWKGDPQVMGAGIKMRAIETVLEFLRMTMDAEYRDAAHSFIVKIPDTEGDAMWLIRNCIGEGDIVGSTSLNDSKQRAVKCAEKYEAKREGKDLVGHSVLTYYLNHFYMNFDEWEE